jgi:hypothetical protein
LNNGFKSRIICNSKFKNKHVKSVCNHSQTNSLNDNEQCSRVNPFEGISDNSVCVRGIQLKKVNDFASNNNSVNKQIVLNNDSINTLIDKDITIVSNVFQVQTTGSTAEVDRDSHSPDSKQHTSGSPEVGAPDFQTSIKGNVTECAKKIHDYDFTNYDTFNDAWCSEWGHRGLSLDNADAGIPYSGASHLGNVEYNKSGVVIGNEGGELEISDSTPEIIRLVTGENKLNSSSDLENHMLDDLDNHWGDSMGCSYPPLQTPMHHDTFTNDYGFIPLEKNEIYQGPESRAAISDLWGSQESNDYDLHNFSSYKVPVPSGFDIEKFKKMAEGYWDEQLFELLKLKWLDYQGKHDFTLKKYIYRRNSIWF